MTHKGVDCFQKVTERTVLCVCVCVVLLKLHGGTHCERETKSIGYGMCFACTGISCHSKKRNDRAVSLDHDEGGLRVESTKPVGAG